ncbi:MAG: amidase [Alphaproteobacteria bacterium]|nr:amidase [Alphaproteobacteria bacterium]
MSAGSDLAFLTAGELLERLDRRELSALEACDAAIARIETLDASINCVVVRDFERARSDARNADKLRAEGKALPLLGVPMTVKESFNLRGWPTTWGFEEHRHHAASDDALAVQRLKAAGAVILGKTNVPPALADWQSANPVYGVTNNPYDTTRSPGGSSGGSAAALAMGFAHLELGSDIGGSIRVPAAFCGVFGHKSSYGLLPMAGHSLPGLPDAPPELSVIGPMARSASDLDRALGVLAGPDQFSAANRIDLPKPRHSQLKDFRVLVIDSHPAAAVDSQIAGAIAEIAMQLDAEGAQVERSSPDLPDMQLSWRTYQAMLHTITTRRSPTGRPPITAHAWMDHLGAQMRLRIQWAEFFRNFDAVIAPAFGSPAFPHTDNPDWRTRSLTIDGETTPFGAQLVWASMATVANLPSTATPIGMSREGLPLSMQIIGPHLGDRTTIALAELTSKAMPRAPLAK